MRIGTDVSIAECRDFGYPVIDFKVKKLFPNGRKTGMDKDADVLLTISNPERWENGKPKFPTKEQNKSFLCPVYLYEGWVSWNDIHERYMDNKPDIDSYADLENCPIEMENPTEHDLVTLAGIVHSWCGL